MLNVAVTVPGVVPVAFPRVISHVRRRTNRHGVGDIGAAGGVAFDPTLICGEMGAAPFSAAVKENPLRGVVVNQSGQRL